MMKRPYRNFPADASDCASFGELKMCYGRLYDAYLEEKRIKGATVHASKRSWQSEREAKKEAQKAA